MHLYGLIIGISILIGIDFFSRFQKTIPPKKQNLFIIGILFFSISSARLYHVIEQWPYYSQNLILIPQTWNGGLSILGGLLGGTIFIFIFSFVARLSFIVLLNSITPILPLCQAIGRFGNYVNHENPTWWLETILDLSLFFIIKKYPNHPTATYLVGYGLIRFITEFWRHDTWIFGPIKIGQIIAIILIAIGSILWTASKKL